MTKGCSSTHHSSARLVLLSAAGCLCNISCHIWSRFCVFFFSTLTYFTSQHHLYNRPPPWFIALVYSVVSELSAGGRRNACYAKQGILPYSAPGSAFNLSMRGFHFSSSSPLSSPLLSPTPSPVWAGRCLVWSALDRTHLLLIHTHLNYWVGQALSGWLLQNFTS